MEGPPTPRSILRGHKAQVHAAAFIRKPPEARLVTGDADGFVIVWDLAIVRPRAVWQAHENALLGIREWGNDRLITHGRDNKLIVWSFKVSDEPRHSTTLPLDDIVENRLKPWILIILDVNSMNFCAFASCAVPMPVDMETATEPDAEPTSALLVAVPNALDLEAIDIFHLPSKMRERTVSAKVAGMTQGKVGMPMSLSVFPRDNHRILICGYENGFAVVYYVPINASESPKALYASQSHTQPILSLDVSPDQSYFLTSGADAIIAKHPIPAKDSDLRTHPLAVVNTKHSGQQGLHIRSDGKIFATAGWDGKVRVYSPKTMEELAVLKWHDVGCYSIALADILPSQPLTTEGNRTITRPNSVKSRRIQQAETAHWIAAGSKDGKISLWDIY